MSGSDPDSILKSLRLCHMGLHLDVSLTLLITLQKPDLARGAVPQQAEEAGDSESSQFVLDSSTFSLYGAAM